MWIVLDPETDIAVACFNDAIDAANWIVSECTRAFDPRRVKFLDRCVVAPFDPMRDAVCAIS